jgi:transcriptional regulator with PAS, ATPase and Fis domain
MPSHSALEELSLKDAVELFETHMIKEALENTSSAALAAQKLGIDASTLSKKRKRYGI